MPKSLKPPIKSSSYGTKIPIKKNVRKPAVLGKKQPIKYIHVVSSMPVSPSKLWLIWSWIRSLIMPCVWLWRSKWGVLYLALVLSSILLLPSESARLSTRSQRYESGPGQINAVPHRSIGLVFGAGVLPNGTPTEYLKHRVETAVDLYKAGIVDKLLMSGDNSTKHYDEPTVMKNYAVKLGVDPAKIIIDYAGYSTYDSCYRALNVFHVTSAAVITQGYHLPRATMTCSQLGIDAIGVAAKKTGRDWTVSYLLREHISTAKAYMQLMMSPPSTVTTISTSEK